jgi:hypothetical protein
MTLGEKQELFAFLVPDLLLWFKYHGYRVRIGDVFAREGHSAASMHYVKLAIDINLFKDGEYLTETEDHAEAGKFWESLHPLCRWGGRFSDGNHYSLTHAGRM